MVQHPLISIEETKWEGDYIRYRILGLDIFINQFPLYLTSQYEPYIRLIANLVKVYDCVYHIGSLSVYDSSDKYDINNLLTGTTYFETPISYYNDVFYDGRKYDNPPSIVVYGTVDLPVTSKLVTYYMADDAMAIYLYEKSGVDINEIKSILDHYEDEHMHIKSILDKAKLIILPQADFHYLDIYSRTSAEYSSIVQSLMDVGTYSANTNEASVES